MTKPGYKTTELWLAAGGIVGNLFGVLEWPGWAQALVVGLYGISRGLAKLLEPGAKE